METIADEEGANYERRAQLRQELAYPIIRGLEAWALNEQEAVMPKSPIGKAIGYLLVYFAYYGPFGLITA